MQGDTQPNSVSDAELAERLIAVIRELAVELHPRRRLPVSVSLDSDLQRDLGLDSLARLELLSRMEQAFDAQLSESALASADTPRDLLRALRAAPRLRLTSLPARAPQSPVISAAAAPTQAATLVDVLIWHATATPQRPHIYYEHDDGSEEVISYADLLTEARTYAATLVALGLEPGQSVALMLPTGRAYFCCFFAVLLAGAVPVPVYPPLRAAQIEEHLRRHARILDNALAVFLITVDEARGVGALLRAHVPNLRRVLTPAELGSSAAATVLPGSTARPADIALLQYTSGSTGNPKGVILTHANLLANIRAMGEAVQASAQDVFVSWMPLYHDMGLIGAWLGSLYYGMPLVVMSPLSFLAHPHRWLWALHRHRATLSGAPNFGYELCTRRIDEHALEGLDLSSWRVAFNGAEPVSPDTLARFTRRFAHYGLRPGALMPVYGLAESSVGLSFPPLGREPLIDYVQRETFMTDGRAEPTGRDDPSALRFVACGRPLPDHEIRIVDAAGIELGERKEGRLQFRGPSATSGYFRNAEATRTLFDDGWLESGDRAYLAEGDVYVTGREKDLIIRAGRNIIPHELEEAIGEVPGIRKGCVAVFGTQDAATATERLIVVAETRETERGHHERLRHDINAVVTDLIGAPPDDVLLAPPHSVLKTSSGKVRRAASRALYERGEIGTPASRPWWQVVRLAWTAMIPELGRARHAVGELLYAAYAWTLFITLAVPVWLAVVLTPLPRFNRLLIRHAARLLIRLSGVPLRVHGLENLPREACVIVANHASYIDGMVLTAALHGDYSFVAKGEFAGLPGIHRFLRNIDTQFVERFDRARGIADSRRLAGQARAGRTLVFFPEGTFQHTPGLLPFRLGAFSAAAEASHPVVPVVLRGTRAILRGSQWFPRRGIISISILPAIRPSGSSWEAVMDLRRATRDAILQRCGEPDLG